MTLVLNAIVFVCGAALMALEMVAARVLAPALGNSIFVWGSVISSVMVALSLGYWLGGHLADRFGASKTLAPVIAAAGLLTCAAPMMAGFALPWAADLGPRAGSLAASALIFFAPSLLMAMVTPLGLRLAASKGMAHIGRSAGSLSSISTGGSIVGTLATSFWLIPLLSLEPLIVAIGFLLLAAAVAALLLPLLYEAHTSPEGASERHLRAAGHIDRSATAVTLVLLTAALALGGWVLWKVAPAPAVNAMGETVLFRQDTQYHRITVTQTGTTRNLRFDATRQSGMDMSDGLTSRVRYPDYMQLSLALKPDAKRVLVLGLGGGAITKRFWHDYPEVSVDSVEIDPTVVDVARTYFGLPEDARSRAFAQDARRFVQTATGTYDIVIMDAYYAEALPFHLTTQEFFRETKARMSPDGVMAYNVISALEGDKSKLFRSLYKTAGTVWTHLWVFRVNVGQGDVPTARQNLIVLATDSDTSGAELLARVRAKVDGRVKVEGFADMADDIYTGLVKTTDVPIMTDAYAPTDSLISVE
ncbi:MAG TPA: fused MFS/spermidine synthase [Coriobacteriia bacterium]